MKKSVNNKKQKKKYIHFFVKYVFVFILAFSAFFYGVTDAYATQTETTSTEESEDESDMESDYFGLNLKLDTSADSAGMSGTIQMLLVLTVLSLAPSILIMMTSFTRIIIVLHFVRTAMGTQSAPPNQVLIGLALFLTMFIMSPTLVQINENAIKPLSNGTITQEEAFEEGIQPIREFMMEQTREKDIKLFLDIAEIGTVETYDDIPTTVLIPAFIISELRAAFIMGFLIYIPFIIIDMVVAATLMSMGMMMLPPTTISMPFKILLFILADGWALVIGELVKTF